MILSLYKSLTMCAAWPLERLLRQRIAKGKEDPERWVEKKAVITAPRPSGQLIWLHAASVGEAQSALSLIKKILQKQPNAHILVTSGTLTSAYMLVDRLPERAFHQFYPLDHPKWVARFLDHWRPDLVLWMESELWPNMLRAVKERNISAYLLNARMSQRTYHKWKRFSKSAEKVLAAFRMVLSQTVQDADYFTALTSKPVHISGNLKYSADDLPVRNIDFDAFKGAAGDRPCWVYASTHASEEVIAAHVHQSLKPKIANLLTIIVPRHPERREDIRVDLEPLNLTATFRGETKTLPDHETDLYVADTLGELGLFYRASQVAMIGRSLSDDGGGGHNPIEAAQLGCATLYGENMQNQEGICHDMEQARAALRLRDEAELTKTLEHLFSHPKDLEKLQEAGTDFTRKQADVLGFVWEKIESELTKVKDAA